MAINTTTLSDSIGDGLQIDGYDQVLKWALRSMPVYRQFVFQVPSDPTNNSRVYHLKKHNYLPRGTRALDEVNDPSPLTAPETDDLVITFTEVGARIQTTYRLHSATYVDIDPAIAKQLATDAADTVDEMVRDALLDGTNVVSSSGGDYDPTNTDPANVDTTDIFSARIARRAVRDLKKRDVQPLRGELYVCVISPETSVDLREETGSGNWSAPHEYVDTSNRYRGEIGVFEGAVFLETNRAYRDDDGVGATSGDGGAEIHRTLFLGAEAVAEAVKVEPFAKETSVKLDFMERQSNVYWRGDLGHAVYRDEAIQIVLNGVSQ